jgi:hypothetical protein
MAQFSGASWNNTVVGDVEAGDHPTVEFWQLYGENMEWLGQTHNHGGDNPDGTNPGASAHGGALVLKSPLHILHFMGSIR